LLIPQSWAEDEPDLWRDGAVVNELVDFAPLDDPHRLEGEPVVAPQLADLSTRPRQPNGGHVKLYFAAAGSDEARNLHLPAPQEGESMGTLRRRADYATGVVEMLFHRYFASSEGAFLLPRSS
jgi:hypothetical protein